MFKDARRGIFEAVLSAVDEIEPGGCGCGGGCRGRKDLTPSTHRLVEWALEGPEILPSNVSKLLSYEGAFRPLPEADYLAEPSKPWEHGIRAWSYMWPFNFLWNGTPSVSPDVDRQPTFGPGTAPPSCNSIDRACRQLRDDARLACAVYHDHLGRFMDALRLYMPCGTRNPGPIGDCEGLAEALREHQREVDRERAESERPGADYHYHANRVVQLGRRQATLINAQNACLEQARTRGVVTGAARTEECNARAENMRRLIVDMELFHAGYTVPLQDRLRMLNDVLRRCGRGSASCIEARYYPNPDPRPDAVRYLPQSECPP